MATQVNYRGGIAGLNRAMRKWPKTMRAELRDVAQEVADTVAGQAASRARSIGGPAKLVAPTIRSKRDTKPKITMGGARTRMRKGKGQRVGDIVWGAEFGGGAYPTTRQFRPHLGQEGYFLWPTIREHSDEAMEQYVAGLEAAVKRTR